MAGKRKAPYGDNEIICALSAQAMVAQQIARAIGLKPDDELSFCFSAAVSTVSSLMETMLTMDPEGHGAMVGMLDGVVKQQHSKNVQVRQTMAKLREGPQPGEETQ